MATKSKRQTPQIADTADLGERKPLSHVVLLSDETTVPPAADALALIREIEQIRQSRVITLFSDIPLALYRQLRAIGRVERIDLFLHACGGATEVPWRIITLIRGFCRHFSVLVPYRAYSSATHIAMGADEIIMGDMSELGPTDPARTHPLLPKDGDRQLFISVQDLRQCIEFIKREAAGEDGKRQQTPEAWATIYSALFEKVHPLALGAIEQSYALARLISEKALSTHFDPVGEKDKIARIVSVFSDEFFSHRYNIGWKEASELGLPVRFTDDDLWDRMWQLYEHYAAYQEVVRPVDDRTRTIGRPVVWIDSGDHRQVLEERYHLRESKGKREEQSLEPSLPPQWMTMKWEETDLQDSQPTTFEAREQG